MNATQLRLIQTAKIKSITTYEALIFVCENGPVMISQIAAKVMVSTAAITGTIDRFEAMGLAVRQHSKEDRRAIFIRPTDKGRELIASITSAAEPAAA